MGQKRCGDFPELRKPTPDHGGARGKKTSQEESFGCLEGVWQSFGQRSQDSCRQRPGSLFGTHPHDGLGDQEASLEEVDPETLGLLVKRWAALERHLERSAVDGRIVGDRDAWGEALDVASLEAGAFH